jgi:hypothetical protein
VVLVAAVDGELLAVLPYQVKAIMVVLVARILTRMPLAAVAVLALLARQEVLSQPEV